ncbi:hypothetical protein KUTeg_001761 [Tegillarca granosa]|uniref:Pseudouridine synthase I TruA alpha/beta domain-containing protein n=1 Tax=Tegillarca granosa TaxID=220873 RepID=A0ABQ9FSD1_TEGGR|nr:hypothetical protein KUTeg_001761 [Tegillarca granosa]
MPCRCEKSKMRGHKCSYRVKLTMRLGYVNHWFVEVLGDHEQFISPSQHNKSNTSTPTNSEIFSPAASPNQSLNDSLTTESNGKISGVLTAEITDNVPTMVPHSMPNTLTNVLPNLLASQPMSLPINLPNNLPIVSTGSPCEVVIAQPVDPNFCQDMPISLVKVKKEPDEQIYTNRPITIADAIQATSNTVQKNGGRAKARKKFTPSQVVQQKENQQLAHMSEPFANAIGIVPRVDSDSFVRKELRDLVVRRELDKNSAFYENNGVTGDERPIEGWCDQVNMLRGDEDCTYNYVWDDENEGESSIQTESSEKEGNGKDLISRVKQLEAHVKQLRNVVLKKDGQPQGKHLKKVKSQREFDFKKYNTRHVALKVLYLGWDYQGFAVQEDTDKTIETALFDALLKTKLIESRETSNYHRCGRTDKGVISIDLRTNLLEGPGVKVRENGTANERPGDKATEIRYVHILNKVLPPEIRVLAWSPVETSFSAREDGYQMCELTIVGQAFLWHQIRCIVSILFMIGQGKETPEIIEELLNVEKHPRKPQYTMSSEIPLVLYDAEFGDDVVEWIYEADWHEENIRHLQQMWAQHSVRATMIKRMLEEMDQAKVETDCDIAPWGDLNAPVYNQIEWLTPGNKTKVYKPLLERQMCGKIIQINSSYFLYRGI